MDNYVQTLIQDSDEYLRMCIVDNITNCPRDLTDCSGIFRTVWEKGEAGVYNIERGYYDLWPISGCMIFHLLSGDFPHLGDYYTELELVNPDGTSKFHQDMRIRITRRI